VGGVKLALALTELGLIDEYEFVVHPKLTAVQTSVQVANHLFQYSAKDSGTHGEIVFVERRPFGQ
jgi:hypothetical protein